MILYQISRLSHDNQRQYFICNFMQKYQASEDLCYADHKLVTFSQFNQCRIKKSRQNRPIIVKSIGTKSDFMKGQPHYKQFHTFAISSEKWRSKTLHKDYQGKLNNRHEQSEINAHSINLEQIIRSKSQIKDQRHKKITNNDISTIKRRNVRDLKTKQKYLEYNSQDSIPVNKSVNFKDIFSIKRVQTKGTIDYDRTKFTIQLNQHKLFALSQTNQVRPKKDLNISRLFNKPQKFSFGVIKKRKVYKNNQCASKECAFLSGWEVSDQNSF